VSVRDDQSLLVDPPGPLLGARAGRGVCVDPQHRPGGLADLRRRDRGVVDGRHGPDGLGVDRGEDPGEAVFVEGGLQAAEDGLAARGHDRADGRDHPGLPDPAGQLAGHHDPHGAGDEPGRRGGHGQRQRRPQDGIQRPQGRLAETMGGAAREPHRETLRDRGQQHHARDEQERPQQRRAPGDQGGDPVGEQPQPERGARDEPRGGDDREQQPAPQSREGAQGKEHHEDDVQCRAERHRASPGACGR
jgi:hypothetical protein